MQQTYAIPASTAPHAPMHSLVFQNSSIQTSDSNVASMARRAYEEARSHDKAFTFSAEQGNVVIGAVYKALERAVQNPEFINLPLTDQRGAARKLAEQYMQGQKLAAALQGALANPSTLATQLVNNAKENTQNVFEQIVEVNRPRTKIPHASSVQLLGSFVPPMQAA